jgi:hypothetical protein
MAYRLKPAERLLQLPIAGKPSEIHLELLAKMNPTSRLGHYRDSTIFRTAL